MDQKFCSYCGTRLPEGVRFCTKCGTPVEDLELEEVAKGLEKAANEEYEAALGYEAQRHAQETAVLNAGRRRESYGGAEMRQRRTAPDRGRDYEYIDHEFTDERRRSPGRSERDLYYEDVPEEKRKKSGALIAIVAIVAALLIGAGAFVGFVWKPWEKNEAEDVEHSHSTEFAEDRDEEKEEASASAHESNETGDADSAEEEESRKEEEEADEKEAAEEKEEEERPEEAAQEAAPAPVFTAVAASSSLPGDDVTSYYGPNNLTDNNYQTAWNEGTAGIGIGEWVELSADTEQTVSGIEIVAGYPKGEDIYEKNCRPKEIRITTDSGDPIIVELEDLKGKSQRITFDSPRKTKHVRVTIQSVYQELSLRIAASRNWRHSDGVEDETQALYYNGNNSYLVSAYLCLHKSEQSGRS